MRRFREAERFGHRGSFKTRRHQRRKDSPDFNRLLPLRQTTIELLE
jgi:hypothetical protein